MWGRYAGSARAAADVPITSSRVRPSMLSSPSLALVTTPSGVPSMTPPGARSHSSWARVRAESRAAAVAAWTLMSVTKQTRDCATPDRSRRTDQSSLTASGEPSPARNRRSAE